jgi:D-glycero-D-manno-heptose 1,7-bisphosphate phosphatase
LRRLCLPGDDRGVPRVKSADARLRNCTTVFLDRDGTINVKAPEGEYVTSPGEVCLLPGAAAAISLLNGAAIRVILVTNQRWLSSAPDMDSYARVHGCLEELLAAGGAHLDAAYVCPHALGCSCRKPQPGMLRRAAGEHGFRLSEAVMIGDSETDVAAGRAAGAATILLRFGRKIASSNADLVAADLAEAVRFILND